MDTTVPILNNQCVCIVDRDNAALAAVIASHFQLPGSYFPMFECPHITAPAVKGEDPADEHVITRIRGREFNTMVHNAMARFSGCEFLILAGLSAAQKSYLDLTKNYQVVEIPDVESANALLPNLAGCSGMPEFRCRPGQYLAGLINARETGMRLVFSPEADPVIVNMRKKEGLIVIEDDSSAGTVIGINYAFAVNADVCIVPGLKEDEPKAIQHELDSWKIGNDKAYEAVAERVLQRIYKIDICTYAYATFFTEGLPYSLVLNNCIPFTYVNLNLHPDLFIINNLLYADGAHYNGAVVFSPLFFPDEETDSVIAGLTAYGLYCKTLLGKAATVRNLDYHLKEYPYDVLHICSHGGEVDGYEVQEEFTDRHGQKHIIEYDEVVGFAPEPGVDLIAVSSKQIFKKLDGLVWRSKELKEKYGHDVFVDMQHAMHANFNKRSLKRTAKAHIPSSCAIKCSDSIHQGMFQTLSAHSSPLIFNNTCWSWFQIAESFLHGGARTYIGTLWGVENKVASDTAKAFYTHIFDGCMLSSFFEAAKTGTGTASENIYIFWGLHFSTLKKGDSIAQSRKKILRTLLRSFHLWREKAEKTTNDHVRTVSTELYKWIENEMRTNFKFEDMKDFFKGFLDNNPDAVREILKLKREKGDAEQMSGTDKSGTTEI